jgi:hypothetical protein
MQRAYPWLTAILLLVFLGLGFLVLRQKTEIVEVDLHRSDDDRSARNETADLEYRLLAARETTARLEKQAAQTKAAAPAEAAGPAMGGSAKTVHISDIIKEHPEFAALWAAQNRGGITRQYGAALEALNLPPDKLAKIKDLLVERSQSEMDAQQAAQAAGLKEGSAAWRAALKEAAAPAEQEMAALAGSSDPEFAGRLQNQASAQSQIQFNYSGDFEEAGVGLNPGQTRALGLAIANANYSNRSTAGRPPNYNQVDPDTSLSPHDQRILDAASPALSPAQLEIIKSDLIQTHQQQAIMQQYTSGANGRVNIVP